MAKPLLGLAHVVHHIVCLSIKSCPVFLFSADLFKKIIQSLGILWFVSEDHSNDITALKMFSSLWKDLVDVGVETVHIGVEAPKDTLLPYT